MTAEQSVTALYAQAMVQAARRDGIELPAGLVAQIAVADRIPLARQDQLWEAYCAAAADPLAGLRLGARIQIGHLDSVGMLLVTCDTLWDAFEELTGYAPVIGEGAFSVQEHDDLVQLVFALPTRVRSRERTEAAVATLLHLCRWATGGAVRPAGVWFAHAPLAAVEEYADVLDAPVRFETAHSGLVLAAEELRRPLAQANPALHDHLRDLADRMLASLADGVLGGRVRALVREHPDWGRDRVAEQLALSGRHLTRLLTEAGLSFKTVRESTLQDLAVQLLQDGARVTDVATRLGYSDETAFARAFRRWQGDTPAQFRDRG